MRTVRRKVHDAKENHDVAREGVPHAADVSAARYTRRSDRLSLSLNRRGYSLLEVLLAAALATVLLAALWSALSLHLRLFDSGLIEVEQAQLARALFARIATDLERAVPPASPPDASIAAESSGSRRTEVDAADSSVFGAGESSFAGDSETAFDAQRSNNASAVTRQDQDGRTFDEPRIAALQGTSQRLRIRVVRAPAELFDAPSPGIAGRRESAGTTFRSIEYAMMPMSGDLMLSEADGTSATEPVTTMTPARGATFVRRESSGLESRNEFNRQGTSLLRDDTTAIDVGPMAGVASASPGSVSPLVAEMAPYDNMAANEDDVDLDIVPEVARVAFRYFDGQRWIGSWNSNAMRSLPVAVEISIEFRDPTDDTAADDTIAWDEESLASETGQALAEHRAVQRPNVELRRRHFRVVVRLPAGTKRDRRDLMAAAFDPRPTSSSGWSGADRP